MWSEQQKAVCKRRGLDAENAGKSLAKYSSTLTAGEARGLVVEFLALRLRFASGEDGELRAVLLGAPKKAAPAKKPAPAKKKASK